MPSEKTLPFFAAEYNGRVVGIRRTADYDEITSSILKAFPALAEVSQNQIALSQVFPELGKGAVEINRELWKEVLPLAKTMQVVVTNVDSNSSVPTKRKFQPGSRSLEHVRLRTGFPSDTPPSA